MEDDQALTSLPLLMRLPSEDRRALVATGRICRFGASETIFSEGDAGDSLHVVLEGRVRVATARGADDEAVLALLNPGECIGDLSLLDGRPRSATVVTTVPTRTLMISAGAFAEWLGAHPTSAIALLETLSSRLRRTNRMVADLVFLTLPHRLAKQLLFLAAVQNDGEAAGHTHIPVTQAELGSLVGAGRESVNKHLNDFKRQGLISLTRGMVVVKDAAGLRAVV